MNGTFRWTVLLTCAALLCSGFVCDRASAQPRIRRPIVRPLKPLKPQFRPVPAKTLRALKDRSLSGLTALCEAQGQMYGAGPGRLALVGENGKVTQTQRIAVTRIAGISRYTPGRLLVGDARAGAVHSVDAKTGQLTRLFSVRELRSRDVLVRSVLTGSTLASVAFDGRYVYAAMRAGFSSSILKVNAATKQVVARVWAPGPDPVAMHHDGTNLFVIDGAGGLLRRYDGRLKLSYQAAKVPVPRAAGLIVSKGNEFRVLSPATQSIVKAQADLVQLRKPILRPVLRVPVKRLVGVMPVLAQKVAVLICGDVAESGYDCFWNDTVWMYKALRAAGYTPANIYVLYGDGVDFASANPTYTVPETVTDFPATTGWVNTVFDGLKNGDATNGISKMRAMNTLFVWTFDHGGGSPPNVVLCLRDGNMGASSFASKLNAVPYRRRAIFMQQCRSGGFIPYLKNNTTFISTACRGTENAYVADTEKELYNGTWYRHGEYNYYVISAIAGSIPTGSAVNADASGNGKVSAKEGHQWEVSHENSAPEHPQSDDMGNVGSTFNLK